jgi:hypothetical protein
MRVAYHATTHLIRLRQPLAQRMHPGHAARLPHKNPAQYLSLRCKYYKYMAYVSAQTS